MKLILLIMLIGISSRMCCHGNGLAHFRKCFKVYLTTLLQDKTIKGHCDRIQATVDCFLEKPEECGRILDSSRYFFTQRAMFDAKLGLCPSLPNIDKLKDIVKDTDVAQKHRFVDDLGEDHFEPCAAELNKAALKHLTSAVSNRKICGDIEDYTEYLKVKSKEEGCHSKILDHYLSILDTVSKEIIEYVKEHMGSLCKLP